MRRFIVLAITGAALLAAIMAAAWRGIETPIPVTCCHKETGQCYRVMSSGGCFMGDVEIADCADCGTGR